MRVTIACLATIFSFQWLSTICVSMASYKRLGEKACIPSPRRSHTDNCQLYGRSMPITGSCFKRDARVYERVQPRLPEVSRCKSALFRSPKGSQYQLVSDMKLSQICCSACDVITVHNTDFSRDLQYKIAGFYQLLLRTWLSH